MSSDHKATSRRLLELWGDNAPQRVDDFLAASYVCSRWRLTATHTGSFGDLAATGKTSTWTGTHTDRDEQDKLVESWVDWDEYCFLEGLGQVG